MAHSMARHMVVVAAIVTLTPVTLVDACNKETKAVGVCLHVYLERDFLTLERIVYPRHNAQLKAMNIVGRAESLRQLPHLSEWKNNTTNVHMKEDSRQVGRVRKSSGQYASERENAGSEEIGITPEKLQYGTHGWVEGPELDDYCSRLGTVIACFEEVLVTCDSGRDFFRYRHLLHSLARVHHYLCHTAEDRSSKFLLFLKLIECAERARENKTSCHRPNITLNVWNQILRLEVGPELCDSLNTQRACLLDNQYLRNECDPEKEELYRNVSGLFLGTWCRLPLYEHFYTSATSQQPRPTLHFNFLLVFLLLFLMHLGPW